MGNHSKGRPGLNKKRSLRILSGSSETRCLDKFASKQWFSSDESGASNMPSFADVSCGGIGSILSQRNQTKPDKMNIH